MMHIEKIEDLRKFAHFIPALKNDCDEAKVSFVIKDEKGNLADVSINFDCDLFSEFLYSEKLEEKLGKDKYAQGCQSEIIAKNVVVKGTLMCERLKCESIMAEGECDVSWLSVKNDIKAKRLNCHCLYCDSIEADEIECCDLCCVYVKVKKLTIDGLEFKNVTYHGLTFADNIDLSEWNESQYGFWGCLD